MLSKIPYFFIFLFILGQSSYGQEIHFSQFYEAPMYLNPANCGYFKPMIKLNGNYRNQWDNRFVNNNTIQTQRSGFNTFHFSGDITFKPKPNSRDLVSLGLVLMNDKAGEVALTSSALLINGSYWIRLEKSKIRFLVLGIQGGFYQRRLDLTNLQLPDQYNAYDPFRPLAANPNSLPANQNTTYPDLNIGAKYFRAITKRKFYQYGLSIRHINQPKNSFVFRNVFDKLYRKLTIHAGATLPINAKIDLVPSGFLFYQAQNLQINMGTFFRFTLTEAKAKDFIAYNIGMWARIGNGRNTPVDAIIFSNKLEFNQYTIGFSYDINISKLAISTTGRGGPEVSISYSNPLGSNISIQNKKRPSCPSF
jgi:type IX secretion system PorP/SprF family membrane protein